MRTREQLAGMLDDGWFGREFRLEVAAALRAADDEIDRLTLALNDTLIADLDKL